MAEEWKYKYKPATYMVEVLKEYANEKGVPVRSTSDLSSLEDWLLMRLFLKEQKEREQQEEDSQL